MFQNRRRFYHVIIFDGNQELTSKMFLTVKERSRPKDPNEKPNEQTIQKRLLNVFAKKE